MMERPPADTIPRGGGPKQDDPVGRGILLILFLLASPFVAVFAAMMFVGWVVGMLAKPFVRFF